MSNPKGNRGMPAPPASVNQELSVEPSALLAKQDEKVEVPEVSEMKAAPPKTIEVVALRDGFFGGVRIAEGVIFNIDKMEQLGQWMRVMDPKLEAQRQKVDAEKKRLANEKANKLAGE